MTRGKILWLAFLFLLVTIQSAFCLVPIPGTRIDVDSMPTDRLIREGTREANVFGTIEVEHLYVTDISGVTVEVDLSDYTRRDGTHEPTADWDFDGLAITNLGTLECQKLSAVTTVECHTLKANTVEIGTTSALAWFDPVTGKLFFKDDNVEVNITDLDIEITGKMNQVTGPVPGNFVGLTAGGDASDSGFGASDYYTKSDLYNSGEVDSLLSGKADVGVAYTKAETDATIEAYAYSESEIDSIIDVVKEAHRVLYVRIDGSDAGTGSEIDPFLTIAHAYSVAETMTPTAIDPVVIDILGKFTEQVTVDMAGIHLIGYGQGVSQWHYAGNALIIADNGVDPEPWDMKIKGFSIQSTDAGEYGVLIQGIAGTSLGGNELQFMDCRLGGSKSIHSNIVNGIDYQNTYITGDMLYEQTAGIWYEGSESSGDITVDWDDAGSKPSWGAHYGVNFVQHLPRGSLTLLNSGTLGENYRPRELDDSTTDVAEVWSSDKISTELSGKLDTSAVLDDLSDVNAGSPTDGQALVWNDGAGEWQNSSVASGTNTSEVETIIDDYSYNSTEIYTQTETDNLLDDKADIISGGTENNVVTIDGSGNIKDSGASIGSIPDASKTNVTVTCASSGADYSNIHNAIDYVASKGGGTIVCSGQIAFTPASKDVSNITFRGVLSDTVVGTTLFWSNGAGAWYGDNVKFENLIIYCRNSTSGSLYTASGDNYIELSNVGYITGGASANGNAISCGGHECIVVCHNVKKWGGTKALTLNDGSATIYGFDKSEIHCTTPANLYLDASSSLSGGTPSATTYVDDASRVVYSGTVTGANVKAAIDQLDIDKADTAEVPVNLNDLDDVNVSSPSDGESLVWNDSESEWTSEAISMDTSFYRTYYIAPNGNDTTGDGSFSNPWATPGKLWTEIGQAGSAAEYQQRFKAIFAPGEYTLTGSEIVPYRSIQHIVGGVTFTGNVTQEIAAEYEYGVSSGTFRAVPSFNGIAFGNGTHPSKQSGFTIDGNLHLQVESGKTGSTTHDRILTHTRITGDFSEESGTGTSVIYMKDSSVSGSVTGSSFYWQQVKGCRFMGPDFDASTIVSIRDCQFSSDEWGANNTVEIECNNFDTTYAVGNFTDCFFRKTEINLSAPKTCTMDDVSAKWFADNGAITGAALTITKLVDLDLNDLGDVSFTSLQQDQVMYWDAVSSEWKNTDISNLITDTYEVTRVQWVDGNRTDSYTEDGSERFPWKTIQGALSNITQPSSGATELAQRDVILIYAGRYDESLSVGINISVSLIGIGPVVLGDGVGTYYASTTPRDITINFDDTQDYGERRQTFYIGTLTPSTTSTTHPSYGCGFIVSGDINWSGGASSSKEFHANQLKVIGDMDGSGNAGNLNMFLRDCMFDAAFDMDASAGNLLEAQNCEFDETIEVASYGRLVQCEISNGIDGTFTDYIPPGGLIDCKWKGGNISGSGGHPMDSETYSSFLDNGGTFTGGGTVTLLSKTAIEAVIADASIDDLGDVNVGSATDGQMMAWNDSASEWENVDAPSGKTTSEIEGIIDDYSYNSTEVYTKTEIDNRVLNDLSNVNVSTPSDGESLVWDDGAGEWTSETVTGAGDMLKAQYDKNDNGISDSAEVVYDGVNNSTAAEIRTHLDNDVILDASDVETVIDAYSYNSTEIYTKSETDSTIEAYTYSQAVIDGKIRTDAEIEGIIDDYSYNSTEVYTKAETDSTIETFAAAITLADLNDVSILGVASDEILIRNNSNQWIARKIPKIVNGWTLEVGVNGVTNYPCDADASRKMEGIPWVTVDDTIQYYPSDFTISGDKHNVVITGLSGGEAITIYYSYDENL